MSLLTRRKIGRALVGAIAGVSLLFLELNKFVCDGPSAKFTGYDGRGVDVDTFYSGTRPFGELVKKGVCDGLSVPLVLPNFGIEIVGTTSSCTSGTLLFPTSTKFVCDGDV